METVLIVIHLMLVVALIVTVLLQRSEGGALGIGGGGGGGGGFMSGRGSANVLTRATAVLAVGFIATSMLLTILAHQDGPARSILDDPLLPQAGDPAPAEQPEGTILDQIQQDEPSAPQVPQSD